MTTDLTTTQQVTMPSMFQKGELPAHLNSGAIAIETERAIAEAKAQIQLAKMYPRSMAAAYVEFMDTCKSPDFAAIAFYSVPNRGSGPSIRFAEEVARCYGNFEYGHLELSRGKDKSEIEVYAWDKEKNNRSKRQITVEHIVDTKNGPKRLTDQADIDNRIANVASKQMRGRIMALMPKNMVAAGIAECKRTLAGNNEKPLRDRILAMSSAFNKIGVTQPMMEKHLGHKVDDINMDEFADLTGVYNAIRDGGKIADYFKNGDEETKEPSSAKLAIDAQAKIGNQAKAEEAAKPAVRARQQPKAAAAAETAAEPAAQETATTAAAEEKVETKADVKEEDKPAAPKQAAAAVAKQEVQEPEPEKTPEPPQDFDDNRPVF